MLWGEKDVAKENMYVDLIRLMGYKFMASAIRSNNYYLFDDRSGTVLSDLHNLF